MLGCGWRGGDSPPAVGAFALLPADEITQAERQAITEVATGFMREYNVPGFSVAIAPTGRSVWRQCFGVVDRDTQPSSQRSQLRRRGTPEARLKPILPRTTFEAELWR